MVPINFMLRSAREQRNIIYSFVSYLKISPVKLQIKVLTRRADINRHLDTVRREMAQEDNEQCRLMQEDYLDFVQQVGSHEAVTRRFFLIFEYEPWNNTRRSEQEDEAIQSLQSAVHTASNYLRQCGNEVVVHENEDEFIPMYKPHTIEQYKIQQFLDHTFAMEHFLVSPLSRSALMLEDRCGERIAFSFSDNEVREIPIPSAPSPDKVKLFIRSFRALGAKPHLRTFEDVTRWWLNHPNPLTYQQALGLPDELYRRFLSSTPIEDEDAQRLAASGLVSEDAYQDIQLWYLNGNTANCWLGPLGIDGTGNLYALTFNYGTPRAKELKFYLLDDYYRHMNHIL